MRGKKARAFNTNNKLHEDTHGASSASRARGTLTLTAHAIQGSANLARALLALGGRSRRKVSFGSTLLKHQCVLIVNRGILV